MRFIPKRTIGIAFSTCSVRGHGETRHSNKTPHQAQSLLRLPFTVLRGGPGLHIQCSLSIPLSESRSSGLTHHIQGIEPFSGFPLVKPTDTNLEVFEALFPFVAQFFGIWVSLLRLGFVFIKVACVSGPP